MNKLLYFPLRSPQLILRLLRSVPLETIIAFDLEDSADDVLNPENAKRLKRQARENLSALYSGAYPIPEHRVMVRINASSSGYQELDLSVIAALHRQGHLIGIMIPKVETVAQVEHCLSALPCLDGSELDVELLIESRRGVAALPAILSAVGERITTVALGHYDYCYDAQVWPFWDYDSGALWQVADLLIESATAHQIRYRHATLPYLGEHRSFPFVRERLLSSIAERVGVALLSVDQHKYYDQAVLDTHAEAQSQQLDAFSQAQETIEAFEAAAGMKRAFAVSAKRFTPPHEYLAARRYLETYHA
jgi:citrate lyase beta subunit